MITDANRPGQKGYLFNAQRIAASILVQMGDIPQAEAYMRQKPRLAPGGAHQRHAWLAYELQYEGTELGR